MTEKTTLLRKKLRYIAAHRGTKEADLIIGQFVEEQIETLNESDLISFKELLDVSDAILFDWLLDRAPVPAVHQGPVFQALKRFVQKST